METRKETVVRDQKPFTMKIIGRRKETKVDLLKADPFLKMVNILRGNKPFIPKGVYKFKTFEESQEWTLKMMTRR
jgi:hypothetical protein